MRWPVKLVASDALNKAAASKEALNAYVDELSSFVRLQVQIHTCDHLRYSLPLSLDRTHLIWCFQCSLRSHLIVSPTSVASRS